METTRKPTLAIPLAFIFLDQPFESFTSTCQLLLTLAILSGVVLVLAKAYYNAISVSSCPSCHFDRSLDASNGKIILKGESVTHRQPSHLDYFSGRNPAAARMQPDSSPIRSSTRERYTAQGAPPVGAVHESSLAQRRRNSGMSLEMARARRSAKRLQETEDG